MKPTEQTREEALCERLHLALGHLLAAEALAEGDEVVHVQMAKSAICRVLRALEPPLAVAEAEVEKQRRENEELKEESKTLRHQLKQNWSWSAHTPEGGSGQSQSTRTLPPTPGSGGKPASAVIPEPVGSHS